MRKSSLANGNIVTLFFNYIIVFKGCVCVDLFVGGNRALKFPLFGI